MHSKSQIVPLLAKLTISVLILLVMTTPSLHHDVMAKRGGLAMSGSSNNNNNNNNNNNDPSGLNVIIGTRSYTKGTSGDDLIIGCPGSGDVDNTCNVGDTLRGLDGKDILQGSIENDYIYGDNGDDTLNGATGNDQLYGGPGADVLQGAEDNDFLVGGPGNDELYADAGNDVLIGGPGADYFDCGDGQDVVVDFNPAQGDTHAENCEVILTHSTSDIDFMVQHGIDKSHRQALGVGSFKDETSISDLGKKIK